MTNFSPEIEERLEKYERIREEKINEIIVLWTKLRKKQKKKAPVSELNEILNEWFEITDGLDALDGIAIEKVIGSLKKQLSE